MTKGIIAIRLINKEIEKLGWSHGVIDNTNFSPDPKEYYFWVEDHKDLLGRFQISITPKSWYDEEHCLLDTSLGIDNLLCDNGIVADCDSTYVYQHGSAQQGKKILIALGLTEKQMHW